MQIDDELLWVSKVDTQANQLTVPAWGRAQLGSTAAAHSSGVVVLNDPDYPNARMRVLVNEVVGEIYPQIFQVKTTEFTSVSTEVTYGLPADCDEVMGVSWQTVGPSQMWAPMQRWDFSVNADTTAFPTGRSIDIFEASTPGRTIKVTYRAPIGTFVNDTDTLASVGLRDSSRDVLVYGVCARALAMLEAARLQSKAVQTTMRDQLVPNGTATQASRAMYQLYQSRLQNEAQALNVLYPTTIHFTRL